MTLIYGHYPGLSGWIQCNHKVSKVEKRGWKGGQKLEEWDVRTQPIIADFEDRGRQSWGKDFQQYPEVGKHKEIDSSQTFQTEKATATYSSTLAWKLPWTEEPGRLQSMGSRRVRHNWATSLSLFTFMHWRRKWQPTPVFLPGESQGREAWWAAIYGVAQSRTQMKWLSNYCNNLL